MSKLDSSVINYTKLFSIDMIKEANSNNYLANYYAANIFYNLYMNNLVFDYKNENFANRDRVVVSPTLLPSLYSTLNLMGFNISLDNLKEYKKFNSITSGIASNKVSGIDVSCTKDNIVGVSIGTALGEQYLEGLIKKELPKSNLINFHTYVVCELDDLMIGSNLESLNYISDNKLKKLHLIVLNSKKTKLDKILDVFDSLEFDVLESDVNGIDKSIADVRDSKEPSIILVTPKEKNELVFNVEEIEKLRTKFKIEDPYNISNSVYNEIKEELQKRLDKKLSKWYEEKSKSNKEIVNSVLNFLEKKEVDISINIDNIKINDTYDEELIKGNNKILNLVANKSPFVLSLSNDFNNTNTNIKGNKNYLFNNNILTMNASAIGLASLGFKVFVSTPLINSNLTHSALNIAIKEELPITFIFTHDSFLNMYEDNTVTYELNSLRLIPNLYNFRPADINEIIGVYAIVSKLNKPCTITIGSEKVNKLVGTNPKYVVAGAYRVKRERGEATGVLIASGSEVAIALKLVEELLPYNIDLRVVSIPSKELFEYQSERYKYTLLPYDLKTFVLEYSSTNLWREYASSVKHILGVDKYCTNGTKEELLNYYNLDMDSLKTRIIELMKED